MHNITWAYCKPYCFIDCTITKSKIKKKIIIIIELNSQIQINLINEEHIHYVGNRLIL